MSTQEKVTSCYEHKEPVCRKETCEETEIDPRSFCHNICAKPEHVCGKTTCEKYISKETDGQKVVCIPRRKCLVVRHFGPEPETLTENKKSKSKRDTFNDEKGVRQKSTVDDVIIEENEDELSDGKFSEEEKPHDAQTIMKNLMETMDPEGIAAIYALAGSEICPCCKCKVCQCQLRHRKSKTMDDDEGEGVKQEIDRGEHQLDDSEVPEKTVLKPDDSKVQKPPKSGDVKSKKSKKPAYLEKEELVVSHDLEVEGSTKTRDSEEELVSEKSSEESKRQMEEERKKKAEQYGYSFDYYNEPDLDAFEAERRIREEKERLEEVEREKKAQERAEEEKKRKEEEEAHLYVTEGGYQAEPETTERGSQFYGKEQKQDLIDAFSKVPVISDKVEAWTEKPDEDVDWAEYKASEWAGMRHQDMPTVVETQIAEVKGRASGAKSPDARTSQISRTSRLSAIGRQSIPKTPAPQIDLQQHAFDVSWLDDAEKHSLKLTPQFQKSSIEEEASLVSAKIEKPDKAYSSGPVLKPPTSDIKPEMIPLMALQKKALATTETGDVMESQILEEPSESVMSYVASGEKIAASVDDFESAGRGIFLTDMCECLPGYCTCGKEHYTFKKEVETEDFGMGFRTLQVDQIIPPGKQWSRSIKEIMGEQTSEKSTESSCSCFHSDEEKAKVTPVVSREEVVAVPPAPIYETIEEKPREFVKCTPPKYQKTLVIVKPEAVRYKDVIFRAIQREGLDVLQERLVLLSPEQVAEIYTENFGSAYFPMFVKQLSSAPVLVIALAGTNAVQRWNKIVGPEKKIPISWFYPASMRRRFSVNNDIYNVMKLSDDFERAKTEIRYFFPLNIIDPILISSSMVQDYCDAFIHPTLLRGLLKLVQAKPVDPIGFLAEWLLINNPFQPFYKQIHVSLAPT